VISRRARLSALIGAVALLAAWLPLHVFASSAYGCTVGSGPQATNLAHCGGYFAVRSDGTLLPWQVYLPDPAKWGPGPYPTVLDYSGYEPGTTFFDGLLPTFVSQGYAVAGVNVRGTGCAGGNFDYFEPKEWWDGYDAVEFLARQPWSNQRVAMVGKSYPGITPLYVAATRPPHLSAIVPGAFFSDLYRDVAYPGGIENIVFAAGWGLGSQPANTFDQWSSGVEKGDQTCIQSQVQHAANPVTNPFLTGTEHQFDDPIYHQRSPIYFASQVQVPVFAELAWQDEELAARSIDVVNALPRSTPWRAVISNGDHGEYYAPEQQREIQRFLAFYLKQSAPAGDPCLKKTYKQSVKCYQAEPRLSVLADIHGDGEPSYKLAFPSWPATTTVDRLFLHGGGALSPAAPSSAEPSTSYTYLPGVGTSSYGTLRGFQSRIPQDDDFWQHQPPAGSVASFTTAPFPADTLLTGTASADLWMSSTAPDTDLEVMVTELRPDGAGGWLEEYVQKGWLRVSQRALDASQSTPLRPYQTHQLSDVAPLVPSVATPVRVEIFPFSQLFRAGERLRVTIEAPTALPELWGFAALPTPAENTIYTDPSHPSSLALPLATIPAGFVFPAEADCTADSNHYITNQPCRPAQ